MNNVISNYLPSQHHIDRSGYGYSRPLDDDELQRIAPAIFADGAHDSRSRRYAYIPTRDLLNGMRNEGFFPVKVTQAKARDDSRAGYCKHLIRFRRQDQLSEKEAREVVLVNSHDGTSGFKLMAGVFRLVCSNGLIVGHTDSEISVRHSGDALHNVIEGAYRVVSDFDAVSQKIEGMKSTLLSRDQQMAFGKAALALKFEGDSPVVPQAVIRPKRTEDTAKDLWTTFNVVQEHLLNGGLRGLAINANGRQRRMRTRAVNGIDQNVQLNRSLWVLAEEMQKLAA
jgi:hypothetical protein